MEVLKFIGLVLATCLLWLCILAVSIGVPMGIVYVGYILFIGTDSVWVKMAIVAGCTFPLVEIVPFITSILFKKA